MKKKTKKRFDWWKIGRSGVILWSCSVLVSACLLGAESAGERPNVPDAVALQEAKVARESAERRAVALELELEKLKRDYDALRSQYADLYLKSHATVDRMRDLELAAANLLQKKDTTELDAATVQAFEALSLAFDRQAKALQALDDFEKFMSTMMDVLRPSDAMRHSLAERVAAVKTAVEQGLKPLSSVARRGSGGPAVGSASILEVHKDMQLVILDKGLLAGIRPGLRWHLADAEGKVTARLLTVDSRQEFSAAVLLNGSIEQLAVGGILLPQ